MNTVSPFFYIMYDLLQFFYLLYVGRRSASRRIPDIIFNIYMRLFLWKNDFSFRHDNSEFSYEILMRQKKISLYIHSAILIPLGILS